MADPIIGDHYRALCIAHGPSGMPEDRYVTSWAFAGAFNTTDSIRRQNIIDALEEFWTVPAAPSSTTVAGYLSGVAIDEARGMEVRVYHLGDAPPREPVIQTFPLPALSASVLPNEVAACLSFYADRNLPRSRGRVFIGPLAQSASNPDAANGDVRVHQTFREAVTRSAARLVSSPLADWGVISQMDAAFKGITGGWMDDAFDTQRRRGVEPATRTTFGSPG